MRIKVFLDDGAKLPTKAHEWDAGYDLYTPIAGTVLPKNSATINTGVHMEIPKGYVGLIFPKSGLNVKKGILSFGVIDAGYTGSIVVKLYNLGDQPVVFDAGDKITQLVIQPILITDLEAVDGVDQFGESERGANGFGSTGK